MSPGRGCWRGFLSQEGATYPVRRRESVRTGSNTCRTLQPYYPSRYVSASALRAKIIWTRDVRVFHGALSGKRHEFETVGGVPSLYLLPDTSNRTSLVHTGEGEVSFCPVVVALPVADSAPFLCPVTSRNRRLTRPLQSALAYKYMSLTSTSPGTNNN